MSPIYSEDHLTYWQLLPHMLQQIYTLQICMFIPTTPTIDWDVLICIPYIFVSLKIYLQTDCKSQKTSLNWLTIGRITWMSNYLWRESLFLPKVEKWPLAQDPKQQPFSIIHSTPTSEVSWTFSSILSWAAWLTYAPYVFRWIWACFFRALPTTQLLVELSSPCYHIALHTWTRFARTPYTMQL